MNILHYLYKGSLQWASLACYCQKLWCQQGLNQIFELPSNQCVYLYPMCRLSWKQFFNVLGTLKSFYCSFSFTNVACSTISIENWVSRHLVIRHCMLIGGIKHHKLYNRKLKYLFLMSQYQTNNHHIYNEMVAHCITATYVLNLNLV